MVLLIISSCSATKEKEAFRPKVVFQSDDLVITRLAENTYQHTSYLLSEDFGKVDCNGMLVIDDEEVIVFDTPADSISSDALLNWVKNNLNHKVIAVIATHFHVDCVGGLKEFHERGIPSYANDRTIAFAKEKGFTVPQQGFSDSLTLRLGNKQVMAKFFGEGHTKDNVIGYFPSDNALFGGCLIKELGAGKGNLEDAHTTAWAGTVEKIKKAYPTVELIIPGHGKYGNQELLDYTIKLFSSM